MSNSGKAFLFAATLVAAALIVYVASVVFTHVLGGGGLDGPCTFFGAPEGSRLGSEISFWPPGYECTVIRPNGKVNVRGDEAGWVSPFVLTCLSTASLVAVFGAAVATRRQRVR